MGSDGQQRTADVKGHYGRRHKVRLQVKTYRGREGVHSQVQPLRVQEAEEDNMRDLIKIRSSSIFENGHLLCIRTLDELCRHKLEGQIGRKDFTILNITKVQNMKETCLDCYVDYEFWGGK